MLNRTRLVNIETVKLYEVQKYLSMTNHMWNGNHLLANGEAWKALPKKLQDVLERAFDAAAVAERSDVEKQNGTLLGTLKSQGMVANTTESGPFRDELRKVGYYAQWRAQFGAKPWSLLERYVGTLS